MKSQISKHKEKVTGIDEKVQYNELKCGYPAPTFIQLRKHFSVSLDTAVNTSNELIPKDGFLFKKSKLYIAFISSYKRQYLTTNQICKFL
jgi:DNA-binding GntR family transcriptional regulator